ncbi:MAG TPA: AAA family ATPase, partial [Deinococcales bacterium]|nr:AAA family ATPase [Deinococcales bacterium]
MARVQTQYRCDSCGYASPKPLGRCPNCSAWNSFNEVRPEPAGSARSASRYLPPAAVTPLPAVSPRSEPRFSSGISELDRVLGGGWVPGGVTLIGGEPGIGKSTLLLQVADNLARGDNVLYVAGEESLEQVRLRADRLGARGNILMTRDTSADGITLLLDEHRPRLVIVDSIQTVQATEDGTPGSVS